MEGALSDLSNAAPELGPALGLALQSGDVLVILVLLGQLAHVDLVDGGPLGHVVAGLGGVRANSLSAIYLWEKSIDFMLKFFFFIF